MLVAFGLTAGGVPPHDALPLLQKVKMTSIPALTFRANRNTTTHRQKSAEPQLTCIGGDAPNYAKWFVTEVRCRNMGYSDEHAVQWACETDDVSDTYSLEQITITCEGFESPTDPYILAGSCSLRYALDMNATLNAAKLWVGCICLAVLSIDGALNGRQGCTSRRSGRRSRTRATGRGRSTIG